MRSAAVVLGLCVALASVPAQALAPGGTTRIAVLPPDVAGDSERIEQAISGRLLDGLKRGDFEVVNAPAAALNGPCEAPKCDQAVAQAASSKYVIRTRITPKDNVYEIVLEARDRDGRVIATAEDKCEICGLTELGDLVSDRGAALAQQLEVLSAAPPLVIINTNPSGANVWVDDTLVGRTPLEHEVTAGSHEVRVESDGFVGQRRTVNAVAGVKEEVQINLARTAVDSPHPGRGLIIGGAVSLVAGVGLVGGGIPLLVIDEEEITDNCNPDDAGNCEKLYNTGPLGAAFVAIGAAGVIAGAVMLGLGLKKRKVAKGRLAAAPSGIVVRF